MFSQELFMDYDDYDQPLHKQTNLINFRKLWFNNSFVNDTKDVYFVDAQINEVKLRDNPLEHPWQINNEKKVT